jgi:hypothetical protein
LFAVRKRARQGDRGPRLRRVRRRRSARRGPYTYRRRAGSRVKPSGIDRCGGAYSPRSKGRIRGCTVAERADLEEPGD